MKQFNKYFTFLGLYIAQSIPMSFFTTVVPVIMRQENYSLESIGLLQFVKLPWILKFIWAPLIDKKARTLTQYKKWIICSEIFYAVTILSVGLFNLQTDFHLIIILIVLAITASATQDIATDALAILTLKKSQRSMGNAVQSIGGFTGALIGSGVLLLIYNFFGWKALLTGLAGIVLIAVLPLRFFKYELSEKKNPGKISFSSLTGFFTAKNGIRHVLFLVLSYSGLSGLLSMIKPYMVDHGYTLEQIGFISGILGTATAAVAAFLSGLIIKIIGLKKSIAFYLIIGILVGLYFIFLNNTIITNSKIIIGVCGLWGVYGMMNVAVYMLAMNRSRSGLEGTDFTVQIVIAQFGSLIIAGLSGLIAGKINYNGLFIFEIALSAATFLYVMFIYRKSIEE